MPSTLAPPVGIGEYPRRSPVQCVVRALGCRTARARQLLKDADPRCPFLRVALIVAELRRGGQHAYAERRLVAIDVARQTGPIRGLTPELRDHEQEADGREDVAGSRYERAPSRETWRAWRSQLVAHATALRETIAAGDAQWGPV